MVVRRALDRIGDTLSGPFGCALLSLLFLVLGAGFLTLFASRAWRDVRVFTAWQQTDCTIISTSIGSQRSSRSSSGSSSYSYRPEITFRYEVDGVEYECTGWDSWALAGDYGGGSETYYLRVLDGYEIGRTYPCWYDPDDPSKAVLVRRVRPLYVLAVLPLALLVLGVVGLVATFSKAKPAATPEVRPPTTVAEGPAGYSQRLAVRLEPVSTPAGQSGCALILAAVLLAIAAVAAFAARSEWLDGTIPVVTGVFTVLFGGLGLLLLWVAVVAAMAARVPATILEADRAQVEAGGRQRLRLVQPGPLTVRSIRTTLLCEELEPVRSGSPTVRVILEVLVHDSGPLVVRRDLPYEQELELAPPADARPSSGEEAPAVRWRVQVSVNPARGPRFAYVFPIVVTALGGGEGTTVRGVKSDG